MIARGLRPPSGMRDTRGMPESRKRGPSVREIPNGDNRERLVCPDCGFIQYENPKLIVGAVCLWEDRVLLCRRAIPPRYGYWTIPAGFMELNESTADGAAREVVEESRAKVAIEDLLGLFEIPWIGQVCVFYRARLLGPECGPTGESSEVALVPWGEVPWDGLAFPSVRWALERCREGGQARFHVARKPAEGSPPFTED